MVRLNKIGILSYGYIMAVISAIVSFLYVLLAFPAIQMIFNIITNGLNGSPDYGMEGLGMNSMANSPFGTGLFITLLILAPIFGALSGFIAGCLGALVYNIAAKWTGGIECSFVKAPVVDYSGKSSMRIEEEPTSFHKENASVVETSDDEPTQ